MAKFRVVTEKYNWTVEDNTTDDPTVFLGNCYYKSPVTGDKLIKIDDTIVFLDKIIAIERL